MVGNNGLVDQLEDRLLCKQEVTASFQQKRERANALLQILRGHEEDSVPEFLLIKLIEDILTDGDA